MSVLLPMGTVAFHTALARTAELRSPKDWGKARPIDRELLSGSEVKTGVATQMACQPGSVAHQAYRELRPLLADGTLPSSLRMATGAPQKIPSISWTAGAADQLADIVTGRAVFGIASGGAETGVVLIKRSDLEAVLSGEPVLPDALAEAPLSVLSGVSGAKRGRRHKAAFDEFWIEVCTILFNEGLPNNEADLHRRLAQWCEDNMGSDAYAEGTIRTKLRPLLRRIR